MTLCYTHNLAYEIKAWKKLRPELRTLNVTSSQLAFTIVRALHRYRRGHGFESRLGLKVFFSGFNFTTA